MSKAVFLKENIVMFLPQIDVLDDTAAPDDDVLPIIPTPCVTSAKIPNTLKGMRLDAALAVIIPEISRNKLTNWIKSNHVLVNDHSLKPSDKVLGGETVKINAPLDESIDACAENIPLNIVYEDDDIIVINKVHNLVVHPGAGNWHGTVLNALLYHNPNAQYLPRAGIVHRLDKDTTGLMVIAKTSLAQINLITQLQNRSVSRIYRAIVHGHVPQSGCINKNIGRDLKNRVKMATFDYKGKPAITNYRVLTYFNDFSYIECKLETGRTHQIRVHMKSIGHPIVADPLYGSRKINYPAQIVKAITLLNRQALHAFKLSFIHPVKNELIAFTAAIPFDMKLLLNTISENNKTIHENNSSGCSTETNYDNESEFNWETIYVK